MTTAPSHLRTNAQIDPCGLPVRAPLLSWWCGDERASEVQSGFQIQASTLRERLENVPDLWDSGKVDGTSPCGVPYAGRNIESRALIWWRVRTFDSDGIPSAWSTPAQFEFSIQPEQWSASWIAPPVHGTRLQSPPVPLLRRRFRSAFQPVAARLYIAVAGSCRVWINESELDLTEVPSGLVDYTRRIGYRSVRVDGFVRAGANSITVLLGDGWYAGFADGLTREHFGNRPELRVQLEIEGQPNEQLVVGSDAQWEWRPSPLLHADLSRSSAIDGRAFGHDPEYARQKRLWLPVDVIERPARMMFPVSGQGVVPGPTVAGKIERRADLPTGERRWWVEFPQTVLGRVSLTLHGQSGRYFRIRYNSSTDERDQPVFSDSPHDTYTLSGDHPREVIAAPFVRRAFRRVEITGDIESRELLSVEAIPLGLTAATTLELQSDHPGISQLLPRLSRTLDLLCQEVIWSGVDVDTRRTDLAQLYPLIGIVAMTRDLSAYLREWLEEVLASEADPAGLPAELPRLRSLQPMTGISAAADLRLQMPDDSGCSETVVKLCLELFQQNGDRGVLERVFPFARRLVYSLEKTFPELIRPLVGFENQRPSLASRMLGTALWHECITDTARIAELLELNSQASALRELADRVQLAFRSRFVTPSGLLVPDDADGYVAALAFGLLEEDVSAVAFERLCELVVDGGYRANTHPLLGARILDVLSSGGRDDLAWAVALRLGSGSWLGRMDRAGQADDVLRDVDGEISLHQAVLVGWLVNTAAGLKPDVALHGEGSGWQKALIAPRVPVGELFPEGPPLKYLQVTLQTASGHWRVEWQVTPQGLLLETRVPVSCVAMVQLPDSTQVRQVAGEHVCRIDLKGTDDQIPILSETL